MCPNVWFCQRRLLDRITHLEGEDVIATQWAYDLPICQNSVPSLSTVCTVKRFHSGLKSVYTINRQDPKYSCALDYTELFPILSPILYIYIAELSLFASTNGDQPQVANYEP